MVIVAMIAAVGKGSVNLHKEVVAALWLLVGVTG